MIDYMATYIAHDFQSLLCLPVYDMSLNVCAQQLNTSN